MNKNSVFVIIVVAVFVISSLFLVNTLNKSGEILDISVIASENENNSKVNQRYYFIEYTKKHNLKIEPVLQLPDYPTGCEIVSLSMALTYITKENIFPKRLIESYLPTYSDSFVTGFWGHPESEDGGGTFPPCIVQVANDFFNDEQINLVAFNATGITKEQIKEYIDLGFPIICWTTMYMTEPVLSEITETVDGTDYRWYTSEHCVLIKGYSKSNNTFIINDPLIGEVERDIDEFMNIHDSIGNMAVVIM